MDFYLVHQNYDYERNERQMCYYGRMGERCEVRLRMREKSRHSISYCYDRKLDLYCNSYARDRNNCD